MADQEANWDALHDKMETIAAFFFFALSLVSSARIDEYRPSSDTPASALELMPKFLK